MAVGIAVLACSAVIPMFTAGEPNAPLRCQAGRDALAACVAAAEDDSAVLLAPGPTTGTFTLTGDLQLGSGVTLDCVSGTKIDLGGASIDIAFASDVVIHNCSFDGKNNASLPAFTITSSYRIRFDHDEFANFRAPAIYSEAGGLSHLRVFRNTFVDVGAPDANDAAIYIDAQNGPPASDIVIDGNTCDDKGDAAGFVKVAASASGTAKHLRVSDNIVVAAAPSIGSTVGVELYATDGLNRDVEDYRIVGNTISLAAPAATSMCISAYGAGGTISGNSLQNCQWAGIEVLGSKTTVSGNALNATGPIDWDGTAESRHDVAIRGNALFGTVGAEAIHLLAGGPGGSLRGGEIARNFVDAPQTTYGLVGIQVLQDGGRVDGISVHDNTLAGFSSAQAHGAIDTEGMGVTGITIEGNYFSASSGVAMFLNGGERIGVGINRFVGAMVRMSTYGRTSVIGAAGGGQSAGCCGP